jgi:hypothetical protein
MPWSPLYTARAIRNYQPNHEMDLELLQGDLVEVMGIENDCWVNGKNLRSLEFGSIPVSCVIKETSYSPASKDSYTKAPPPIHRESLRHSRISNDTFDKDALDFRLVDEFAMDVPSIEESSTRTLSKYLASFSSDPIFQYRAFYIWITNNIAYNASGFLSGNFGPQDAESVLRNRTSVCQGYAELFLALCQHSRLPAELISGYGKGVGSKAGIRLILRKRRRKHSRAKGRP